VHQITLPVDRASTLDNSSLPLLFGVQATDAGTLVAVVLTILVMAVAACGLPAWRASRLDPGAVLRDE